MTDRFTDHRGTILDLIVQPLDAVTEIFTHKGAVRGNHYHEHTTQWTYIVSGRMRIVTQEPGQSPNEKEYGPGEMTCEQPMVAHAWLAVEDTTALVFTSGPRSGENYELDTHREGVHLLP